MVDGYRRDDRASGAESNAGAPAGAAKVALQGRPLVLRFLTQIRERRRAARDKRYQEWEHMSKDERRFMSESVEDHQADKEAEAHLGGGDPPPDE
jgi:hypothetical protein